ncbi:MAG: NUDIX domain-containing protein [Lentisphaeria bacterium]|nr:NUDIX domain-containing protein [Lentisphaeria bacterium]
MAEFFDIIDDSGKIIGRAARSECHGNPALIHRSVRVVVYHPDGDSILLQKRSASKDIFPGRWDMAVGGHLDSGEEYADAALRELSEELGITRDVPLKVLYDIQVRNEVESENIRAFGLIHGGPFQIREEELDEVRFFSFAELRELVVEKEELFTPLLVRELKILPERIQE